MKTSILTRAIAACAFTVAASAAQGAYVYSFQGVDFTLNAENGASQFTFQISGAPDATGDWASATRLGAFEFQGGEGLGINWGAAGVSATAIYQPGGATSVGQNIGLNAKGCDGGSPSHAICFAWSPQLVLTDEMNFTINIIGAVLEIDETSAPHLKIQFTNDKGKKVGDLLSKDMAWEDDPVELAAVPVPGTLALLGMGALGLGIGSRRRRAA